MSGAREATVLARLRLLLAAVALVATYLDPTQPSYYAAFVYGLLLAYVAYGAVVLLVAQRRPGLVLAAAVPLHCADLVVTAALTLLTEGVSSPFFVFFTFILLSAAWQWGLRETLLTALSTLALLVTEAILASSLFGPSPIQLGEFELNRFIVRSAYVLLAAVIVGRLAEAEKDMRRREAAITRLLSDVLRQTSLKSAMETAAQHVLALFGGGGVEIVASQARGPRFVWSATSDGTAAMALDLREVPHARRTAYELLAPGACWMLRQPRRASADAWELVALDQADLARTVVQPFSPPSAFMAAHRFRSALGTSLTLSDEWTAQVFLFDPAMQAAALQLPFFHSVVQHCAPVVHSVYLARRLRSRATAIERTRMARELHDGVIQSLLALDIHLDALQRDEECAAATRSALAEIQGLVKNEIAEIRELMQLLRTASIGPAQLVEALAEMAGRLERQTGIRVRFVSEVDQVSASPQVCREVARIFQEALANVRKHSGATNVYARLSADGPDFRLVVEDDGCGFDFAGRMTLDQLDGTQLGPLVIKERVRAIGGTLIIESSPGDGARLDVLFPPRARS